MQRCTCTWRNQGLFSLISPLCFFPNWSALICECIFTSCQVWQYITLTKRIYLIDCPGIVPTSAKDSQTSTVLKGVVRVEALPTPSEHIPALMERVKPVYLSRTYGVPLPDPADPTKQWDPETLLDKLARMKGRLLKGGEPDLEAVSKILLSDWVRGRIPYFVSPPERSEELNAAEEKNAKRKAAFGAKGKEKSEDEGRPLGVKQNLGSIMQKNTFVADDIRPLDEEDEEAVQDEDVDGEDGSESQKEDVENAEEEPLAWNDVFPADAPEGGPTVITEHDEGHISEADGMQILFLPSSI